MRKHDVGDAGVVVDDLDLARAGRRIQHLAQVGESDRVTVDLQALGGRHAFIVPRIPACAQIRCW